MIHRGALPPPDRGDSEDLGEFCVWWYGRVDRRTRVRRVEWAYARRHPGYEQKVWQSDTTVGGFDSRAAAINAYNAGTGRRKERP